MSTSNLTEDDEGKQVVSADGDTVGMITNVEEGTAYVDPDPDVFDTVKHKLNWDDTDGDEYPIDTGKVAEITDDQVRLA